MLLALSGTVVDVPAFLPDDVVVEPRLYRTIDGGCDGFTDYNGGMPCFEDITDSLKLSGIDNSSYQLLNKDSPSSLIPIITAVVIHPEDKDKAWITFTGYEPTVKVWFTEDGGNTWQNADLNQSLNNLPVNDIVYQRGSNDRLYIATDAGIYYKDDNMSDWERFCDFPNVRVVELKINYCMGKIRAATFGRSVWQGDLLPTDGTLGNASLLIKDDATWTESRGLDRNLRIENGNTLTIDGATLSMPKDGKIIIEAGAELRVINGAVITNNCDEIWGGIEVRGDPNDPQTAANQATLILNNATISHAQNAVALDVGGFGGGGGGIVDADNTTFLNNKRSVEFAQYNLAANISDFNNCDFLLDDNYRLSNETRLAHITMFDVTGVKITACDFSNTNTSMSEEEREEAIFVLDAGFDVQGNSTFSGFERAISVSNAGSVNTFTVKQSDFSDNSAGIYLNNVNNAILSENTFSVGERFTSSFNHGIYIEECTGFMVEGNILSSTNNMGANEPVGMLCKNTGDSYNRIFDNNTTGMENGFRAEGDNRDNSSPNVNGLEYLCNQNSNNTYDFIAVIDNSMSSMLSGIRDRQGDIDDPAGNTFSLNGTPTGSDFRNNTNWLLKYYYGNGANETPSNVFNVSLSDESKASSCVVSSRLAFPLNTTHLQQYQERYETAVNKYTTQLVIYQNQIDKGDTESLMSELQNANTAERKEILLATAPWVSEQIILQIIEQGNFNSEDLRQILEANPDIVHNIKIRLALESLLNENEIIALLNLSTARSEQAHILGRILAELQYSSNVLISNELLKAPSNNGLIESYLQNPDSRMSQYALVDYYLQNSNLAKAIQTADAIEVLTEIESNALADYQNFVRLIAKAANEERALYALTEEEVNHLVNWAVNSNDKAKQESRAILNFFYDYDYLPDEVENLENRSPSSSPITTSPISRWQAVTVQPNPAQGQVTFSYDLSNYTEKEGILQIHGMDGQVIQRFNLRNEQGRFEWNTESLESGLYFYKLYLKESATSIHKLLIVK